MGSRGESNSAKEARRKQQEALARQEQREKVRLAEADSEVAKRKAMAGSKGAGRRSLIKTSPTGLSQNLGGTTNAV